MKREEARSAPQGVVTPLDVLGRRIRRRREEHELTLRELGRRVGVSPSAVWQIETGRALPSLRSLRAIATELEVSLDALFDGVTGEPDI